MPAASRPTVSAAMVAAKGVDFLEPLKPAFPALAQATVSPVRVVIVMIVLLKVALMWATPSASTWRFFFLTRFTIPCASSVRTDPGSRLYFRGAFFLPATARRGPFRVRAFVCVRWPRTGRFRLCRIPR